MFSRIILLISITNPKLHSSIKTADQESHALKDLVNK